MTRLTAKVRQTRPLYAVRFRHERTAPAQNWDDIDPREQAQGCQTFKGLESIQKLYPGHDSGSLHAMSAEAVLTWKPQACDEVIHVFEVSFVGDQTFEAVNGEVVAGAPQWRSAEYHYSLNGILVSCESTPGRGATLGEDGLEDAFGNDALYGQVESALAGDWRQCLVSLKYAPETDDAPAAAQSCMGASEIPGATEGP